jgi:hypothetical protein
MSYSKVTGKPKQLSFVVNYMHKNAKEHVFVHINTNGDIVVNGTCAHTMTAADLTQVLVETINPLLIKMNDVLDASGYKIAMFENVYDERIEYINLKYTCGITRNFNIKPTELTTILSNMFHVYEADINKGAILRFKNVENYKEMNAMNALITQIYKTTNDLSQVKKAIMENFVLTDDEAREVINKYLNEHIIINGNYVNKSIDVAENPGFPCLMRTSTAYATPEIIIEIAEISSIHYIDVIHRYLDVFLRVTQHGDKSSVSKDKLLKMMAKKKNVEELFTEGLFADHVLFNKPLRIDILSGIPQKNESLALSWAKIPKTEKSNIIQQTISKLRNSNTRIENQLLYIKVLDNEAAQYWIEFHRKFALTYAIIVLFFVGAPLGAIIRKGGFGAPVVIAAIIFMIYFVLMSIGNNLANSHVVSPFLGMWMAGIFFTPIAFIITRAAANDSQIFNLEAWQNRFIKLSPKK